jgi:SAM-dependent methyltransferase
MQAYKASLQEIYESVLPHLPGKCAALLDVGSGLGGIDVLLSRHYGHKVLVCTIDGEDDPAEVKLHRIPFNNQIIQADFLRLNGVLLQHHYSPDFDQLEERFDLVVSFASWCFHFPPEVYLDRILLALSPAAVIVLDVRNSKPDWLMQLRKVFGTGTEIATTEKFTRMVWKT